jgi:hypothetical protein
MPRRLIELVEHYPYDQVTDASKDNLLPRPRFSTRQYDALFIQVDTEYTGALKPKSHPLRLIADALRAQSKAESATADDADLWDTIKKASLTLDTQECTSDANFTEPIPIFSNIFSDETIRLLSLIRMDAPDKDKSAPSFVLYSPISPSGSRPFSLLESPLSPVQTEHARATSSSLAHGVPGLTTNSGTAPTTASPETPTDWLQFSNQGFGTIPGSRDLAAKLWDDDVEVTVPPAPLSRKSSRCARSRGSSVDSPSAQTDVPPPPVVPAPPPPISKTTLITKVKLDEAFIDFWADSLLDPISNLWSRFVLCQLKPLPPAVASITPTPEWLFIEQRFVHIAPPPPPKEEVEATIATARPRSSSPRPESSRLSAAFSLASKKRFGFFTIGSGDPKSPKEKSAPLPHVGELGEVVQSTGDDAVIAEEQKSKEEARAQDGMDGGLASVPTAVEVAVAVAVAAKADPSTPERIIPPETAHVPEEPPMPERTVEDAHASQDSEPASIPGAEPTHVPAEGAPVETLAAVPAPAVEEPAEPAPEETTAPQVPEAEPIVSAPSPPDLPVEAEATSQDPFTETVAPGIEETNTLKEPPASTPIDTLAAAEPVSVPEKPEAPLPEDDVEAMGEVQVATLAGPVAIAVENSPVMEPVPAVDGTAPIYQALPVDDDKAAASSGAAEASAPLEESSPVAVGLDTEEDAQPAALLETHAIPEEPADIEATVPEPGAEPIPVAQTDTSPSPAIPEAPPSIVEPTIKPIGSAAPLAETNPPLQVSPEAQDGIIEEQPTTEEAAPVVEEPPSVTDAEVPAPAAEAPHPSADESMPPEVPATSHVDEDAAAEPTVAERTTLDIGYLDLSLTVFSDSPVAEPIAGETSTDGPESASGNVSQEVPGEPATELVSAVEPEATAVAHDPADSHANGSAQPTADHATASEPIATVTSTENDSIASQPTVEESAPKAEESTAEHWQAVSDESAPPSEEPAAPAESTPVSEEPVPPAVSEMPTQTPVPVSPAAVELDSTTGPAADVVVESPEEAPTPAPAAAETPVETPVLVAEEPAPDNAEVASPAPAETSVPVAEDPTPAPEQSVPASPETPAHDEPAPAPIPEEAVSQTSAETPAPLPEEPVLSTETTANAALGASVPAAEDLAPDVVPPIEIPAPVTEDPAPAPESSVPALPETLAPTDPASVSEEAAAAATSQTPAETPVPLPEEPTTTETAAPATAETQAPEVEGPPSQEPAVPAAEETVSATENHPIDLEGTVEEEPAVEEELPESEQVAQEPATHPSDDTTEIVAPEPASVPGSEIATALETEALVDA